MKKLFIIPMVAAAVLALSSCASFQKTTPPEQIAQPEPSLLSQEAKTYMRANLICKPAPKQEEKVEEVVVEKSETPPKVVDLKPGLNKVADALASCQSLSPFNKAANLLNGRVHVYSYLYHGQGRADIVTARLAFEQALRNPGDKKDAWFWLAFIQHELGWEEKAKRSLKKGGSGNLSWDSVEKIIKSKMPTTDEEFSTWVDSELKRIEPLSKSPVKPKKRVRKEKINPINPGLAEMRKQLKIN